MFAIAVGIAVACPRPSTVTPSYDGGRTSPAQSSMPFVPSVVKKPRPHVRGERLSVPARGRPEAVFKVKM